MPKALVDDGREIVGDHDLLDQAPADQLQPEHQPVGIRAQAGRHLRQKGRGALDRAGEDLGEPGEVERDLAGALLSGEAPGKSVDEVAHRRKGVERIADRRRDAEPRQRDGGVGAQRLAGKPLQLAGDEVVELEREERADHHDQACGQQQAPRTLARGARQRRAAAPDEERHRAQVDEVERVATPRRRRSLPAAARSSACPAGSAANSSSASGRKTKNSSEVNSICHTSRRRQPPCR